jgi:uncharacterized protein YkwD
MQRTLLRFAALPLLGWVCLAGTFAADASDKPKEKLTKEEQVILDLTNKARKQADLPALKPNPVLIELTRAHSENMAKQEKLSHTLDEKGPAERATAAGYPFTRIGENIALGNVPVRDIFQMWMKSPLHKKNILNGDFEEIGIGSARSAKGETYYTQVFGKAEKKP